MARMPQPARRVQLFAAATLAAASLTLTGCGFDAQTLQAYTPAHGVNVDQGRLMVRNLLIIANAQGKGRLSAAITSQDQKDTLKSVSGVALKADGSDGAPLTVGTTSVDLPAGQLAVLTGEGAPTISVSSPDLKPGLTARLQLTFGSGIVKEVVVPVMDAAQPMYASAAPDLKG